MATRLRAVLRLVHLWAAIALGLPLVLIGLSGSALIAQREALRLLGPSVAPGERQSVERIVAAARAAAPAEARASWVDLPAATGGAAVVQFQIGRRSGRRVDVAVDPVALGVLGAEEFVRRGPVKGALTNVHAFLMLPEPVGFPLVGWMGVALALMALSGLVLWWPGPGGWRRAFLVARRTRGTALHLQLHRVAGIWGFVVLFALALSGLYLVFPLTVGDVLNAVLPHAEHDSAPVPDRAHTAAGPLDADGALALARAAVPDATATGLQLAAPRLPYVVQMEPHGFRPKVPAVMVTIDAPSGAVSYIDDPRAHALAERVPNLLHALHFALGLGGLWTAIVFAAGLLPLFLAVTGLTVWWRVRRRRGQASQNAPPSAA